MMTLPFGCFLIWAFYEFQSFDFWLGLLLSALYSLYWIGVNVYHYLRFENISSEDFLACNHRVVLEGATKELFKNVLDQQFIEYDFIDFKGEWNIKIENDTIKVSEKESELEVVIERDHMDFLPDKAKNYKMLLRIEQALLSEKEKKGSIR